MSTTPEQELQWAERDYRIAVDNLAAAERRLDDATYEYNEAMTMLTKARQACRTTSRRGTHCSQ